MAPLESEWMLWAKRLQMSIRAEFDKELQNLPNRYTEIAPDRAELESLKDQIRDLATSHDHVHLSNQTLRDRVQELEAEHFNLDQKATIESKTRQETAANLAKQLGDVATAFDQFKRDSWAVEEEKRRELQGLRKQIEGFTEKAEPQREGRASQWTLHAQPRCFKNHAD